LLDVVDSYTGTVHSILLPYWHHCTVL
jgi:hypothetical protein